MKHRDLDKSMKRAFRQAFSELNRSNVILEDRGIHMPEYATSTDRTKLFAEVMEMKK